MLPLTADQPPRAASMTRHKETRGDWRLLAIYGTVLVVVALVGLVAIWSFVVRQALVIQPEPLPRVTVVTTKAGSPLGAAWVRLLTRTGMQATLVPLETFDPIEGIVLFCDVDVIPPRLAQLLDEFVRRGGAISFVGKPPQTAIGRFRLFTEEGMSDAAMVLAEAPSPLLARLVPGTEVRARRTRVTMLKESPRMRVDVRWKQSARAAVMHMEMDGARYMWFGFEPDAVIGPDNTLLPLLRSAFRWQAGQPVSDGAVGAPQEAKSLTPDGRRRAREDRFVFSVDRTPDKDVFAIRMINRGGIPLPNPTVKLWVPSDVTRVAFTGDFIMTRNATLTGVPEDGTCLVSLPRLTRNEERVMKLKITGRRVRNVPK